MIDAPPARAASSSLLSLFVFSPFSFLFPLPVVYYLVLVFSSLFSSFFLSLSLSSSSFSLSLPFPSLISSSVLSRSLSLSRPVSLLLPPSHCLFFCPFPLPLPLTVAGCQVSAFLSVDWSPLETLGQVVTRVRPSTLSEDPQYSSRLPHVLTALSVPWPATHPTRIRLLPKFLALENLHKILLPRR